MALTPPLRFSAIVFFYINHNDLKISRLTRMIEKYAFFAKKKLKFFAAKFCRIKKCS